MTVSDHEELEPCPCCEYPRTGLPEGSRCPECGVAALSGTRSFPVAERGQFKVIIGIYGFVLVTQLAFWFYSGKSRYAWLAALWMINCWGMVWNYRRHAGHVWVLATDGLLRTQQGSVRKAIPWSEVGCVEYSWVTGAILVRAPGEPHGKPRHRIRVDPKKKAMAFIAAVNGVVEDGGAFVAT